MAIMKSEGHFRSTMSSSLFSTGTQVASKNKSGSERMSRYAINNGVSVSELTEEEKNKFGIFRIKTE